MKPSAWKCPNCKRPLLITNSGAYHCPDCNTWPAAETVDQMGRDMARTSIVVGYEIEKMLFEKGIL
jgi:hypothetical protein